jgi:transcriptional regulator with XRE-family HTH domain
MTQVDLAARLGVTQTAISTWERGQGTPSPAAQAALIAALGITPDELHLVVSGAAVPA